MAKFQKGVPGIGGRKKGIPNKSTMEFKEALNNLLQKAAPNMIKWLETTAKEDPARALDLVAKLAEYIHPKQVRTTVAGDPDGGPVRILLEYPK